ncbi:MULTISPECIES: hypothetical protein [unclassified Mesorhizobium]|uniref:hypothetical protein n=1 Tax=unclassified Mesorhizobium TaxID=325217 RepID=UPI003339FF0E
MAFIKALTPKPVLEFEGTRPAHLAALVRFGIDLAQRLADRPRPVTSFPIRIASGDAAALRHRTYEMRNLDAPLAHFGMR